MHEMEVQGYEDGYYILFCPKCERLLKIKFNPYHRVILFSGNFRAKHYNNFYGTEPLPEALPAHVELFLPASEVAERNLKEMGF